MSSFTLTDRFPCSTHCSALTHDMVKCFQKGAAVFYPQNSLCLPQMITVTLFWISLKVQVPRNSWGQLILSDFPYWQKQSVCVWQSQREQRWVKGVEGDLSEALQIWEKNLKTPGSEHLCHPRLLNKTKSNVPALHWAEVETSWQQEVMGLCFRSGTKRVWTTHGWFIIAEHCLHSIYTSFASLCSLREQVGFGKVMGFGTARTQSSSKQYSVSSRTTLGSKTAGGRGTLPKVASSWRLLGPQFAGGRWVGDWLSIIFLFIFYSPLIYFMVFIWTHEILIFLPYWFSSPPLGQQWSKQITIYPTRDLLKWKRTKEDSLPLKMLMEIKGQQRNTGVSTEHFSAVLDIDSSAKNFWNQPSVVLGNRILAWL